MSLIENSEYQLPSLSILNQHKERNKVINNAMIEENVDKLEKALKSFNIITKVVEVHIGPLSTQYELDTNDDIHKIIKLKANIAMALSAKSIKSIVPLSEKGTIGIEFENDILSSVSFYEVMSSKEMLQNQNNRIIVPLGESALGEVVVCEINKMPHLLISGTTGSGKSVCIDSMICSILMTKRPDEVKFVMIDPRKVELSVYNDIPHLMCPVISDPKQADIVLQRMVNEIEKRYQILYNIGVKEIDEYNEFVGNHSDDKLQKMPYIVIIIDELYDLMATIPELVEASILRITQKGRMVGVHLVISTQITSKEVVTDLMKHNIPSRIAFAVSSKKESNNIIDRDGAEELTRSGEMLYLPVTTSSPIHIQGSFIQEDEIERIVHFVKNQKGNNYEDSLINISIEKEEKKVSTTEDDLYNQVVEFVVEQQKASASLIQRNSKLDIIKLHL